MSERNIFSGIAGRKVKRTRTNERRKARRSVKGERKAFAREMRECLK
jgi:hypothetical protein